MTPETHIYFGHHKCASTWTRNILKQIHPGRYISVSSDEKHCDYGRNLGAYIRANQPNIIGIANACYQQLGDMPPYKAFHVIRDPRDIVVSAYYSHRDLPRDDKQEQQKLREVSLEEGLILTMRGRQWQFENMYNWNYDDPNIIEVLFCELVAFPVNLFCEIFRQWGFDNMVDKIECIVEENSFEQLTGRKRGDEKIGSSLRKGITGEWRYHFTPKCKRTFVELYDDLLIKLDYERNNTWVNA